MELLKETYIKNGTNYNLIKRNDKAAIYSQKDSSGLLIGFEVFKIKIQKSFQFPGTTIINPEKQKFPGNEDFGHFAWSYITEPVAMKKFDELSNNA
jgi:hypothetical protein